MGGGGWRIDGDGVGEVVVRRTYPVSTYLASETKYSIFRTFLEPHNILLQVKKSGYARNTTMTEEILI